MASGFGGGLPEIRTLWKTLNIQQYQGWQSLAMSFRGSRRRKKGGYLWNDRQMLAAWQMFVRTNGLLHSVSMPKIVQAPAGINPPTLPTNLDVVIKDEGFRLTWLDPVETNGSARLRVWVYHPDKTPTIKAFWTMQAVVEIGVQELTLPKFLYKGNLIDFWDGIWRFQIDCVNQYGLLSGTSNQVPIIRRIDCMHMTGQFTIPAGSVVNVVVTGVGFTPTDLIIQAQSSALAGSTSIGRGDADSEGSHDTDGGIDTANIINAGSGALNITATILSFDADGFTLAVSNNTMTADIFCFYTAMRP